MPEKSISGRIFNIQKFSVFDGPGIRTVVFFKGCSLRCRWCHNPESIRFDRELEFFPQKCIACGRCFQVCPRQAHVINPADGSHQIARDRCTACFQCAESCFSEALVGVGEDVSAERVMESILEDKLYYEQSEGGVTFSGGECMLQLDFLCALLQSCRSYGIHTAVDTAGNVPWSSFEKVLPYANLFLFDIKALDAETHRALTGADNRLILSNFEALWERKARIIVRIPYIPGCNSDQVEKIGAYLAARPVEKIEILPYHKLGVGKYGSLGHENTSLDIPLPTDQEIRQAVRFYRSLGLRATSSVDE